VKEARICHYSLLTVITKRGRGKKAVSIAREKGVPGATIVLGWGASENRFLSTLGVGHEDRDIAYMVSDPETIDLALGAIKDEMHLEKPNHGIAISQDLAECCGVHRINEAKPKGPKEDENMEGLITVIVDRGKAEDVMDSAKKAGSMGGTIINARGSGVHETAKIFNIEVVPEKEIVLIISDLDKADAIMSKIEEDMDVQSPGKGIMYLQPITKSVGLRK
jgi:nitrogen regulatory protein PII